ncbi:OmpA/MotB domain-containing protein [Cylindrospermum sp. NIES-4074]|nr:OmpA/MotB domain-containing protein [Cylindrospermum sp. NIES-4074]
MYKPPQQQSKSRIPTTAPKTSSSQQAQGGFLVQPKGIETTGKQQDAPKYSQEAADHIMAKMLGATAQASPQADVEGLGLRQRMIQAPAVVDTLPIQRKLTVGAPGDRYEQEADRMASQVMSMSNTTLQRRMAPEEQTEQQLQTKPLAKTITPIVQRAPIPATDASLQAGGNIESRLNSSKSGGSPLADDVRGFMEPRFGTKFDHVRVHTSEEAIQMNRELGAQAFAHGSNIYFGAGKYNPGSSDGKHLLAHELTHTIQQGGSPQIQRAVDTNGGTFDTTSYFARNSGTGVGKLVGAEINLKFTPNDLVETDNIGLVQSVKTFRSTSAGGPVNDPMNSRKMPNALTSGEGDVGRGIDQSDFGFAATTLPQTNPLYAVNNSQNPDPKDPNKTVDVVSKTLTDVLPDPAEGYGEHGYHKRKPDGTFDTKDATLNDTPRRKINFAGQQWQQSFEVTALILDGPMTNTYLGSIEWGWENDATGKATLKPSPIKLVRPGAPTSDFMDAARKWNKLQFPDSSTGKTYDTVDLPTTTLDSGKNAAVNLSTEELKARITQVNTDLASLSAGVDKTNKEFEKRALEAEMKRRDAKKRHK